MTFLIEMKGLPSFNDQRFVRYRFWPVLTSFGPFLPYLGIFEHFWLSERYEIYETLIEKWCFSLKWGVYQVSRTRGTPDIGFDPHLGYFTPFWHILCILGHFQSSERYILYETLIENWVLRSFWGVNLLHTINISGDIVFSNSDQYILMGL